jgi:lysophospholipase L1-like esterase
MYFAPKKGWEVNGVSFRFLTQEEFLHPKKQVKKDISSIVAAVDTSNIEEELPLKSLLKHKNDSTGNIGAPSGGDLSKQSATQIHLCEAAKTSLYTFFEKLESASINKKKIHILHYGDSQIEGDRMTGYIRQRIQNKFGGTGPGLIPATNVYNTITFKQTFSENFLRYTCFGGEALKNKKYGVMGSSARFTPEYKDSLLQTLELEETSAWIDIEPHKMASSRSKTYNHVNLFYTSCKSPCLLQVFKDNILIHEDSLIQDGKYHKLPLTFDATPGKLRYSFKAKVSPTICSFSLEGDFGVQVDNIALRGSSGTIFGKMDHTVMSQMYQDLNTELFILQFGGNSVPYLKDSIGVRRYANYFKGQILTLKRLRPSAAIIVIGPSDMSMLSGTIYETYEFLPYLVSQMKLVSAQAGAGYWDLFGAMGGENSMPAWVEQGLAGKDYIHFSPKGASIASQLFFDAFSAAFAEWKGID